MSQEKISRRSYLKYAGAAVAAGAVAAAGYGLSQYHKPPDQETPTTTVRPTSGARRKVRIGGTKPFTGTNALPGRSEGDANKLWAKMVNEAGGIKAGDGNAYEVELILYNDEDKPENVGRLFEKLITEDKVDFLFGPVYGPLGMATVPVVEKYRKFEVYGTATYDPTQFKGLKYIVTACTNGDRYVENMCDMIWERILPHDPDAINLAITHGDDIFRMIAGTYGLSYARQRGFNIVFYDKYSTSATDLTPMLTKARSAKPTIYLNAGGYPDALLLIKQMRELDFNVKLLWAGTGTVFSQFAVDLGKYADGCISCTQWEKGMIYKHDYGPSHDEFIEAFQREYNYLPDYHAATGFQQGLVIQRAMELCEDPLDSDAVRKAAGEMEMTTFYGKYKVDPVSGWQVGHKMGVIQWQDGEKVVVWPMEVNPKPVRYPMKKWSER
ncbi:amino acid ABC transporter substrate-binding protein [Candidatus Bathyarchaeota archaeon]|nr:amino acid ABC transporter substrate-binding protein [Candidatus Bathyarchaeota archaeon]